jgi:hypothetical protein
MVFPIEEPCCAVEQRFAGFDDNWSQCSTISGSDDLSCCSEGDVETLIFFDWDDTLFPTSWLQRQDSLDDEAFELLRKLESGVEKTLQLALQFGRVVIVTNARQGWVEMCWAKMWPSLSKVLEEVDIVSARSTYEACSHRQSQWKRLAFEHEMQILDTSNALQYNVISLGDSLHEQSAVVALCEKRPNCCAKSVKFMEAPEIEQLIDQHEFVLSCFSEVAEHDGNLDVEIAL